ncbi:MAG: hypothetical protein L0212_01055 [Acidobacteria bacterium]|nr:hypothetical protein [Acidobacteriota bacterium]
MKKHRSTIVLLLAAWLAAATPSAAQRIDVQEGTPAKKGNAWVRESTCSATAREGGRLMLRADLGSVTVTPGANDRVECRVRVEVYAPDEARAQQLLEGYEVGMRIADDGTIYVNGRFPRTHTEKHSKNISLGASYDIRVPARFNVDVETRGGSVTVERLEGELRAVTAAGSIRTGSVSGATRVETAGGNIEVENIGGRLEARTAGGNIRSGDVQGDAVLETSGGKITTGRVAGTVRAGTAGGDIYVGSSTHDVVAQTAGGKIRLGDVGGRVRAETAGGSIFLETAVGPVQVQTAGGSIRLARVVSGVHAVTTAGSIQAQIAATRESFQPSLLETSFGDVVVYLPADLPLTIDAEIQQAMGHEIKTDFPLQVTPSTGYGPRTVEGRGELNGGGELLRIRTTMGNILIRKAVAPTPEAKRKP